VTIDVTAPGGLLAFQEVGFSISGLTNRESEGSTGLLQKFETTMADGTTLINTADPGIDSEALPDALIITAAPFASGGTPTFSLESQEAGDITTITFTLTPTLDVPIGGKIVVEFEHSDTPGADGFHSAVNPTVGGVDAAKFVPNAVWSSEHLMIALVVTVQAEHGLIAFEPLSFSIHGIKNRESAGSTGLMHTVNTCLQDGTTSINEASVSVHPDDLPHALTIIPHSFLLAGEVTPANRRAGAGGDALVTFKGFNPVPQDCLVVIEFPRSRGSAGEGYASIGPSTVGGEWGHYFKDDVLVDTSTSDVFVGE
jgi:hypothetical protein